MKTTVRGPSRAVVLAIFFASGVTALIYQVAWQRMLTLFGGADLQAATTIVSAFMAGLGFGSLAGGAVADRLSGKGRLRAFAACELAIAVFAAGSASLYYDVLYARLGALAMSRSATAAIIFLVTLLPTFLMGMSLPLLAAVYVPGRMSASAWISRLYGWNTLGAAMGSLLTLSLLLPRYDIRHLLQLTAIVNVGCALVAFAVASRWHLPQPEPADPMPGTPRAGVAVPFKIWMILYGLSGFVALSLEIVWFRAIGVMMKSNAFTFGYLLTFFLAGVGLGAVVTRRQPANPHDLLGRYLVVQAAVPSIAAASLVMLMVVVERVSAFQPLAEYFGRPLPTMTFGVFLAVYVVLPAMLILPATIVMGYSFGLLQRAVQADASLIGRRVGWLQAANILGSVAGAISTGVCFLAWWGSGGTLRVLVLFSIGLLASAFWRQKRSLRLLPVVAVSALLWIMPVGAQFWAPLHGATPDQVVVGEDGSGLIVFRNVADETRAFIGGISQSWLPYKGIHTALGALPAMLHPRPERIGVIGLASGDTLFSVAGRPETATIDNIEIMSPQLPALRELAAMIRYPALDAMLADARIAHHVGDARSLLRRGAMRYDILEVDALLPQSASAGNVYSVEFFALLRACLNPGGIAVTWVPTERTYASFVGAFPYAARFGVIAVGSSEPIVFSREEIEARMSANFTRQHYARGNIDLRATLSPYLDRIGQRFDPSSDRSQLRDLNHDLFPKDEFGVR